MLRTSTYTIYVDLPDEPDDMLLVHSYTGAFDKVSRRVATYVRSLEVKRPPKPLFGTWGSEPRLDAEDEVQEPSDETIRELVNRGYLTLLSAEKEREFFTRFVEALHEQGRKKPPSYLFMPSYDCNLRCSYCFQDHMRTDTAYRHLLRTMTRETVDRIFQALPKIEALHECGEPEGETEIGLFGGEPLLARHRPIVEYLIHKAQERAPSTFWAISNGTELDFWEDLLGPGPGKISGLQITLDGPPEEHDQRRVYADGSGSWDRIVDNVTRALELGVVVTLRTNVDRTNFDRLPELASAILEQGWDEFPNFVTQVAPIHSYEHGSVDQETVFDSFVLDRALTELRQQRPETAVLGRVDDGTRRQAREIFQGRLTPSLKPAFCAAHTGMYIFDAFGDVYACWEKTGDARIRIGHVDEAGELTLNGAEHGLWRHRTVTTNPVCLQCRYSLFCGGGCAVLALGARGELYKNYCDGFGKRFRTSVAEAYRDHVAGEAMERSAAALCDA